MPEQSVIPSEAGDIEEDISHRLNQINDLFQLESSLLRYNFETMCMLNDKSLKEFQSPTITDKLLAIHKFLFLTGGDQADVITARDPWGNFIYTKLFHGPNRPDQKASDFRDKYPVKEGEVQEASSTISSFIQRVNSRATETGKKHYEVDLSEFLDPYGLPEVLSEITDVIYNLVNIQELDDTYNHLQDITTISKAMGFSLSQMLDLVITKYRHRYEENKGVKNIPSENGLIADMVKERSVPLPTLGNLSRAYDEINEIANSIIRTRLIQQEVELNRMIGD